MPAASSAGPCRSKSAAIWYSARCEWPLVSGRRQWGPSTTPTAPASYVGREYRQALQAVGIVCGMSQQGTCWDIAPAENFFATLKVEELRHFEFNTRDEARDKVLRYICWYNAHRRHSTLAQVSPTTFEAQSRTATCAA
jgi:transposase InsO family protein